MLIFPGVVEVRPAPETSTEFSGVPSFVCT